MAEGDINGPAGALAVACHLDLQVILVRFSIEFEVDLVEDLVVLGLADRVPLRYRIEFFKEHRLDRLASEMEQDSPCLRHVA